MKTSCSPPVMGVAVLVLCVTGACSSDSPTTPSPPVVSIPFSTEELAPGTGDTVTVGQTLVVAFTGWLVDILAVDNKGAVFDSSDRFGFVLGDPGLIEGWNMGIEGMRVGGLRRIVVPPELGFGSTGSGVTIPPDAALIFEVELLEAQPLVNVPFSMTDLVQGSGDSVMSGQDLTVSFTGWLYDLEADENKGAVIATADALSFTLGSTSVPEGWNRGIEGMRPGGTRRIVIPPELGFGDAGAGNVPPFATLLYEITLLSIP